MEYLQYDEDEEDTLQADKVLNLIINGIPSILQESKRMMELTIFVLNLIINGIPSIPAMETRVNKVLKVSFKPYYKWNTFNT